MQRFKHWFASRRDSIERSDLSRSRWLGSRSGEATLFDLTEDWNLTFALLDDTRAWRERAVHEIVLRDSDHVNASTAYQIRLPLELIRDFEPTVNPGDRTRLLLPFTIRPKHLLLNVDFAGLKGEPAALLLRQAASELQAAYLAHVDGRPLGDQPVGGALWVGVSAYTASAWREHRARFRPQVGHRLRAGWYDLWRRQALAAYLNADLELGIEPGHVAQWLGETEAARLALVEALGEGEDPESSSECILLAIPFMPIRPARIEDIAILVHEFCAAVDSMNAQARRLLAEYGRRWEAILETVVPVGQACSIKLTEQRPWIGAPSPILRQELALGDATTTHVEIRAADHGVVLDRPRLVDLVGRRVGFALADEVRETPDAVAIYAADAPGRYFARVSVRARVRLGHRLLIMWLLVLIVAAGGVVLALPANDDLVESLALLIFPLTLAGAVVLSREATSLAERLLRRWRLGLVVAIASIWLLTLGRLLLHADVWWAESVWTRVVGLAGLF